MLSLQYQHYTGTIPSNYEELLYKRLRLFFTLSSMSQHIPVVPNHYYQDHNCSLSSHLVLPQKSNLSTFEGQKLNYYSKLTIFSSILLINVPRTEKSLGNTALSPSTYYSLVMLTERKSNMVKMREHFHPIKLLLQQSQS